MLVLGSTWCKNVERGAARALFLPRLSSRLCRARLFSQPESRISTLLLPKTLAQAHGRDVKLRERTESSKRSHTIANNYSFSHIHQDYGVPHIPFTTWKLTVVSETSDT